MSSNNILDSKPVSLGEAYEILKKRSEQEPALTEIQSKTLDYLKEFGSSKSLDKLESTKKKLIELGLKEETAIVMIDICPETVDEVFSIIQMDKDYQLDPDKARNILSLLSDLC